MKFRPLAKLCLAIGFLSAVLTAEAAAQKARPDFNRPQTYDVQHYTIRVSFDRVKREVYGDTTVDLLPLKDGFSQAELDATDMTFSSVTIEPAGTALKYKTAGEKIIVTLD